MSWRKLRGMAPAKPYRNDREKKAGKNRGWIYNASTHRSSWLQPHIPDKRRSCCRIQSLHRSAMCGIPSLPLHLHLVRDLVVVGLLSDKIELEGFSVLCKSDVKVHLQFVRYR
ncbi:unnamed protein product [Musa acuminata subsp. burmannicoides]